MKLKSLLTLSLLAFSSLFFTAKAQVDNDLSLTHIISPNVNGNICRGYQELIVRATNTGRNNVSAFAVEWSLNNVYKGIRNFNTLLTPVNTANSFVNVNLGMFELEYNVPTLLKVWTSSPNGLADNLNSNDTFTVTLIANDSGITLNELNDTIMCYNGTLTLDAGYSPFTDYTWSNGTQAQLNTITTPGIHWVWAYSSEGCTAYDTFEVVEVREPLLGNVAITDLGNRNFSFSLINPLSVNYVVWDYGDGSQPDTGLSTKTHNYPALGTFLLTITISNDCGSNVVTEQVYVSEYTSIKNGEDLAKAINTYPNPAKDYINVVYPTNLVQLQSIRLLNSIGQEVLFANDNKVLNVNHLTNGVYQMIIQTDKGIATKKITISK